MHNYLLRQKSSAFSRADHGVFIKNSTEWSFLTLPKRLYGTVCSVKSVDDYVRGLRKLTY